ncbi:uncharacterized mitochondrial protein-like protein [Tanacetum coccineum]
MVWRHLSAAIDDPRPAAGSFSMAHMCRLSTHVIKLRNMPEGVLVLSGLSRVWKSHVCDPVLWGADGNDTGGRLELCFVASLPFEEPHHDIRPTLQRLPFYCTPPAVANVVIPDPTLVDLAVGTPSSKILANAEASQKRKASTSGATSSHIAKLTRSSLAQSSSSTTRPSLFVDNSNDERNQGHPRFSGDVSGDAIYADFFPFSAGPYYATYPEGGVASNCEFTREESISRGTTSDTPSAVRIMKDENEHIEKVLKIMDLFHIPNITVDQVMLRAFLMSLTGAASNWLRNKPSSSITTWEDLKTKFLSKYCLPARTTKKMEEINNFQQEPNETLSQAWEQFKELLMKCSQHYLTEMQTIQAQLNNLGREIKKVNEKVYAAQVGCEQCKGPHYTKDCPLKEEGKTLEEAYYTLFGGPFQGGGYRAAAPGFYQRNNANPSYQERRQSMEETLRKFNK